MAIAAAAALGPSLGGLLSSDASWRWCFLINLPCGVAAFATLLLYLKVHDPKTDFWRGVRAIDWLGTALLTGSVVLLLVGLQWGGVVYPWTSRNVAGLIALGLVAFSVFLLVEWKIAERPLIPLHLFRRPSGAILLIVASCHGFSYFAVGYFLPVYFQEALGATPVESATWFLPYALVLSVLAIVTGIFISKTGWYAQLITFGFGMATLAVGLFVSFPTYRSWPCIIIYQLLVALGLGPSYEATLVAVQSAWPAADLAAVTGAFGLTWNLSAAVSLVLGGVILMNRMAVRVPALLEAGIDSSVAERLTKGSTLSLGGGQELSSSQQQVLGKVVTKSLSEMWIFYAAILLVGFVCSFWIGRAALSSKKEVHRTGLEPVKLDDLENQRSTADSCK